MALVVPAEVVIVVGVPVVVVEAFVVVVDELVATEVVPEALPGRHWE